MSVAPGQDADSGNPHHRLPTPSEGAPHVRELCVFGGRAVANAPGGPAVGGGRWRAVAGGGR